MTGGYTGRLANIDLTNRKVEVEQLDYDWAKLLIGGRGLGAKLLWDRSRPGIDTLSTDALLMFLIGPATGLVPMGAQTSVFFKSPQTQITVGHPILGTHWGPELKFAGYNGLIIRGCSEKPVFIIINNDKIEIKDAQHLWGKGTIQTEVELREEVKDTRCRIVCIGPGGENQIKFGTIQSEYFHAAARGGGGCLMGSKKLKAIVVRGSKTPPIADSQRFDKAYDTALKMMLDGHTHMRQGYAFARWGTTISAIERSDGCGLDVKNYREGYWEDVESSGGLEFEKKAKIKSRACYGCPIHCIQIGVIRQGKYAGHVAGPDFDSTGCIGPGCLVSDLNGLLYLNQLGDNMGLDDISLGNITGWVMECYEKGILTKSDLGGLEMTWGNVSAIARLWEMILRRQGIGSLLAEGVGKAAQTIGKGSEKFAMHAKGLEFGGYIAQANHERGLQYALGDRGGCHHYGQSIEEQDVRVWVDSLTMCTWSRFFLGIEHYLSLLNPITGWELTPEDWVTFANRMLLMARAYNIREGMVPLRDDVLPARFHEDALTKGTKKGALYHRDKFERDRSNWYQQRGCDEAGYPTEKRLQELGLGFAVAEVRKASEAGNPNSK